MIRSTVGVLWKTVDNQSSVMWVESGIEQRGILSIVLRFVTCSVTCIVYPLFLAPRHLKCIVATGIFREPAVRVTFVIKIKSKSFELARSYWHPFSG